MPPSNGDAVSASDVFEAVRIEAYKKDNRQKLRASNTEERHLLVYVDSQNLGPWCALVDFEPPRILPDLPPEVTGRLGFWKSAPKKPLHDLARRAEATMAQSWRYYDRPGFRSLSL